MFFANMQPGVEPGKHYKITFKQAETGGGRSTFEQRYRQFNIFVNGRLAYESMNILDNVRMNTAFDLVHYTVATDDSLPIRFEGVVYDALSSAILVEEVAAVSFDF